MIVTHKLPNEMRGAEMNKLYLVVFGGGIELPSYSVFDSLDMAKARARMWAKEIDEDEGEWVDLLEIESDMLMMQRLFLEEK
jgi:hypothetical protein